MILWIVLPHIIYFILTLLRKEQRLSKLDLGIYLWLPALSVALALSAYILASITADWGNAGLYIPLFLGFFGGIGLMSGGLFILLGWIFR